jgi:Second Messenger Oligonucleotide or Dinucleotide Synthetase domain
MGGSGSRSTFSDVSPAELQRRIREAEMEISDREFGPKLAERLNELLARVNDRNEELTSARLKLVKESLGDEFEEAFELKYGGSVAKHTFVDGLSDVDLLLVVKEEGDPHSILGRVASKLERSAVGAETSTGRIAVTLTYPDGEEIQLVPAIRTNDNLHVPAWNANEWSRIDPDKFRRGLSKRNASTAMKVVPTIKLAKAVTATLPEDQRLSGYHIESMAIAAFRNYEGPMTVEKMLPYFIKSMSQLIKTPIRDSSGQSVHVDEYLGRANSEKRRQISQNLDRIARRMDNATAGASMEEWNAILGE